jgi:hypothetical protein
MHIHGVSSSQIAALIPTQSAQHAMAARRADLEVRRKLSGFASTAGTDSVAYVDAYTPGDRGRRKKPPQDDQAFRNVLVSIKI